jgi:stage V sporulation protein T
MKATGIVRRVDDLGRVVIPKEIRQTLKIREGDPLELWLDKDTICFKKYNVVVPLEETLKTIKDMLADEDVSRRISAEDRACVSAMVDVLIAKWKESEGNNG